MSANGTTISISNLEYNPETFGNATEEEIQRILLIHNIIRLLRRNLPQEMYETCIRTLNKEIPLVVRQELIPVKYRNIFDSNTLSVSASFNVKR
jgi:hypothetical protein